MWVVYELYMKSLVSMDILLGVEWKGVQYWVAVGSRAIWMHIYGDLWGFVGICIWLTI